MQLLQFLSSQNPNTFASVDESYYYGPILCDEEEIIGKTKQCMPGYVESGDLCYKVLDEKMTKAEGEAACGVTSDWRILGILELFDFYFIETFIRVYTSGNITLNISLQKNLRILLNISI